MGCWGITAFESDAGLDAVDFIRHSLPKDGQAELGKIIEVMKSDVNAEFYVTVDSDGELHSGPMALAEIMVNCLDGDTVDMDYDEDWAAEDNKFADLSSFTADKDSVKWLRDIISETLGRKIESAEFWTQQGSDECRQWGGWFEEKNWIGWQNHMKALVSRLDGLLALPEGQVELIRPQEQANGPVMGQSL